MVSNRLVSHWKTDGPPPWVYRISILWRLPLVAMILFMGVMAAIVGTPIITTMAAGAFLLGVGINATSWTLFRLASSPNAAEAESAMRDCFRLFCTAGLMIPAVFAPFPGWMFLLFWDLPDAAWDNARLPSVLLILWGLCGIYYGAAGLVREWRWGRPQLQNIRNLPTAKASSAALGLVELHGTARAVQGQDPILYFKRWILVEKEFNSFEQRLHPFEIEDASGRIRVDPSHIPFVVHFPFFGFFTSLLGHRPFFALLRRHVRHGWWPSREFFLRDGDPVYVLGTVEIERDAETGEEYRVVRPPHEARHHDSVVESLLYPFQRGARRAWQDVFVIADTEESVATKLLARRFRSRVFWGLFWTFGSIGLLSVL